MNEEQELQAANKVLEYARNYADLYDPNDDPMEAERGATIAILHKALELATQKWTVDRRNKLLKGEWE